MIVDCAGCGKKFSARAPSCPFCGAENPERAPAPEAGAGEGPEGGDEARGDSPAAPAMPSQVYEGPAVDLDPGQLPAGGSAGEPAPPPPGTPAIDTKSLLERQAARAAAKPKPPAWLQLAPKVVGVVLVVGFVIAFKSFFSQPEPVLSVGDPWGDEEAMQLDKLMMTAYNHLEKSIALTARFGGIDRVEDGVVRVRMITSTGELELRAPASYESQLASLEEGDWFLAYGAIAFPATGEVVFRLSSRSAGAGWDVEEEEVEADDGYGEGYEDY